MISEKNVDLKENAAVTLTITVDKGAIRHEYDELVKKYAKTVQIKGFRKGKVPSDVLIRKFADALLGETAEQIIHKSLEEALESIKQKPLPYSTPEVDTEDSLKLDQDFTYKVTYETFPEVDLGQYKGLEYEKLKVKIGKEDEERELKNLQEQNALVVDKKDNKVEEGDIVNIDYVELDAEGNEVPASKRESFVFEVGTGYNLYKIDDQIVGMVKEEEKTIKKSYPEDFEHQELAGREVELKIKVNSIKEKQLPELDDELAQDISEKYNSLEDLKEDIRKRLGEFVDKKIREHNISQILDKVLEGSKIELPRSMVEQELSRQWEAFLSRYRTDEQTLLNQLQAEGKTKIDILEGWRPESERRLKLQLAVNKMAEQEKIAVGEEEIDEKIRQEADTRNISFEELKKRMSEENYLEYLRIDARNEKLYDLLLESAAAKKGRQVKFLDLTQGNY